jgi:hypothetical protein
MLSYDGAVTVTSSPVDQLENADVPMATRFARTSLPRGMQTVLYELNCTHSGLLRIQANNRESKANSKADYVLYAGQGGHDAEAFNSLLREWLRQWQPSPIPSDPNRLTEENLAEARRGLTLLMQVTGVSTTDLITGYEAYADGQHCWPSALELVEALLARERPTIEAALTQCCQKSPTVRFLLNLPRAEEGLDFDRKALAWGRHLDPTFCKEYFERATRATAAQK